MNKNKESLASANINSRRSRKKGLLGVFENLFRQFPTTVSLISLCPLILIYITCVAIACLPGVALTIYSWNLSADWDLLSRALLMTFSFSSGGFFFVITLIFVVPIFNLPFKYILRRNGNYKGPWYSAQTVPWFMHNAMIYLVRYTVLDFMTPSPINELFFRMMGMKIGKNVMINSSNISDACLIELGDNVTIGGSAVLMAHYGMHGLLVIDKLTIKDNTTIGLNAMLFGSAKIGSKVTVSPNTVVYPKTDIADGEKFGFKDA